MTPRPFLLISTRPEADAAAAELASFSETMKVPIDAIEQRRVESAPLGEVELANYSGVILGGSPFNNTDLAKSELQLRVEREIGTLVADIIDRDFPLMGACYGIGAVGTAIGARLGNEFAEDAGAVMLSVSDAGKHDPVLEGLPDRFESIVGHKENISTLPESATVLVSGDACPIQMFRVKANVYATQFHPELTAASLEFRLRVYAHLNYFDPQAFNTIVSAAQEADYTFSNRVMENFARCYRRF
ncbi:glutamine amidotransferase [Corynebacterium qintianiae]|uniref:Glutamine amidotransferase n=1 Tax=Corynebacterium qintianiae TaxID=2709392 RepID=A0A7T0KKE8_9CORY|nr:glutamine amidotransferase [Corynebacterium qintianiae]QPK82388.1 glutamine amidotransferase [Corynebacterium qintianiae]